MVQSRLRGICTRFALLAGSVLFTLIVLEIGFRIYMRGDYSVPSHRNWLFQGNWETKHAHLNSLGHRDHEFTVSKPDHTFRIVVIGDSFTFGEGIDELDDIYTEILENKLNSRSDSLRFEVLNISQKGLNVYEYLSLLKRKGLGYEPDMVLIGFFLNDIEADASNRPKNYLLPESLHWWLSRFSYLYWYTYNRIDTWRNKKNYLNYYLQYSSPDSDDWKRFVTIWSQILDLCRAENIVTVVAILPHLNSLDDQHPFLSVYDNVETVSRNHGAQVIQLFPAVKGIKASDLWVGVTDGHPNKRAHRIFAEEIFRFLEQNKLVPIRE